MRIKKSLLFGVLAGILVAGCEFPGAPDFKTAQKVEAPILYNKTFQFLGGSNALLDTTSQDLDSLFTIDDEDFILITKEQDFDFGDLNDAIPNVNVDPTNFEAQVGEIKIENFSSGANSNLGTADFQQLTGIDPSLINAGTPIPGGITPSPVNISIGNNTDYFVSAIIKSGALRITVVNNLGFNIDQVNVDLKSGANLVGSTVLSNLNHQTTTFNSIFFAPGVELRDLNVDISVEWVAQNMQDNPGDLVVENVVGVDLVASQVEAVIESQDFTTSNLTVFDDSEFQFSKPTHYVELESGNLQINSIQNSIDITVDTMIISFPGIRKAPYAEADSLVISYLGADAIPRSGSSPEKFVDLSGYRIYAKDNQIAYNIVAKTENTQTGTGAAPRIINETNTVASSVAISNLAVKQAYGLIVPQNVILGDDDFSNGIETLDLYNDIESEVTEIDGMSDISSRLDGTLEFTSPTLDITYTTSVGVGTTVYGAFLGINSKGEEVFLKGLPGSDYEVQPTDPITGLQANGALLNSDQLIKFELETSSDNNLISGSINFNTTNTNVDDFLNNLPSEIRFIGKAVINEANTEGTINTPVQFSPKIEVGLPLAFKTSETATFSDTTETEIDIPSEQNGDKVYPTEGRIIIEYSNGLPLNLDLNLDFVDENGATFMSLPIDESSIELLPAEVDPVTRFAAEPVVSSTAIELNRDQMNMLNQIQSIVISANFNSTNNEEVKLRTTDSIVLTVKAVIKIEMEVK